MLMSGREDFRTRGAPLEYWFIKVARGELAFQVDWIVRRSMGQAQIRISYWVRGHGCVVHAKATTWRADGATVQIAGCTFTPELAVGTTDNVRWDLRYVPGSSRLEPVPFLAKVLRPFDLQLVARPRSHFSGTVEVGGESFAFVDSRGTVNHYWGRRLPDSWAWVSADNLNDGETVVEAALFRTRIWGAPHPSVTGGYVMVDDGRRRAQIIAPVYGRIAGVGDDTCFKINAQSGRRRVRLTATVPRHAYNDLGQGIRQSLLGNLSVDGWGSSVGQAGLELRGDFVAPLQ
jgi:hypothetical protein